MNENDLRTKILQKVDELWSNGAVDDALEVLRDAYLQSPNDRTIAYQYGHMLGDLSFNRAASESDSLLKESVLVLGKLCKNLNGLTPDEQWKIRRHFYLYSGQHLENRALGYQELTRGNPLGVLSVGFGCLHHALDLLSTDQFDQAQTFAKEGEEAFRRLLSIDEPKFGRHLAHALTLAILGQREEALNSTQKAADLMEKKSSDLDAHRREIERLLLIAEDRRNQ